MYPLYASEHGYISLKVEQVNQKVQKKMENNTKQHKSCLMVAPRTNYLQQFTGFHTFDITKDNFIFNRYFKLNLDINIGVII